MNEDTKVPSDVFRQWEAAYYDELCCEYRIINSLIVQFKTMEEVERFSSLFHQLPILEYRIDLLLSGDDDEKFELYKDVELNERK